MRFALALDEFRRLECRLGDEQQLRSVYAAGPDAALDGLAAALDELEARGAGECVRLVSNGEYRRVFRRQGAAVRLAVMFLCSVAVGYRHVYWGEHPAREVIGEIRDEIRRFREHRK